MSVVWFLQGFKGGSRSGLRDMPTRRQKPRISLAYRKEHFSSTISTGFPLLRLNCRNSTEWRPIHGLTLVFTGTATLGLDARIRSSSAIIMRFGCQKARSEVARVNTKSLTLGEDCNSEQKRVLIDPIAITIIYYPTTSNTISVLFFKYSRNLFPLNQTLLGPATGATVDEPPSFSIRTSALKGWIWCEAWGNHNSSRLTTFAYVPLAPCLHTGKRQCHA